MFLPSFFLTPLEFPKTEIRFTHVTELDFIQVAVSQSRYHSYADVALDQNATNLEWSYTLFAKNVDFALLCILLEQYNRNPR
jgi:hypothetical protein